MNDPQWTPPGPGPDLPGWWPDQEEDRGPGLLRAWIAENPAAHLTVAGVPAAWVLGWTLHEIGCTYQWTAAATAACAAAAAFACAWIRARPVPAWADPPETIGPLEAIAGITALGGWETAAATWGPAGPYWLLLAAALAVGVGAGWWCWLRDHDAVAAARARRDDSRTFAERKAVWDDVIRRVPDLAGCDVLDHVVTLVGEQVLLDTRGTGHLASSIRTRAVEERIGELWQPRVPRGRIDCWVDEYPGRLWISVRSKDPWRFPVIHPLVSSKSIAARYFPATSTVRRPLILGPGP